MIEFRSMNFSHIDQILNIESSCFSLPWSRNMLLEELDNELAKYTVILFNGTVAGYAGMWYILDEAHITNIAIHPTYQGMGLGKSLLEYIIRKAKDDGIKRMTLEVRSGNDRAVTLYSQFEFKDCGRRKRYYADNGEDAIIMWRKL